MNIRENTTTQQIVTTEDVWSALTRVHDTILRDSVELDKLVGDILYEDLWDLYA